MHDKGVLLYYKYIGVDGAEREHLRSWYEDGCTRLALRGRIRVALDGVNVTVWATCRYILVI